MVQYVHNNEGQYLTDQHLTYISHIYMYIINEAQNNLGNKTDV